jgi:transposase-like protein
MVQTRAGVSAKQLQREIGCTYKTAWRIAKQIRMLMAETGSNSLTGIVEIDETYVGGKAKNRKDSWGNGIADKEVLMGMVEREGKAYIRHIPNSGKWTLLQQIQKNVDPKARIMTDEWRGYTQLKKLGFKHKSVNHRAGQYRLGDVYTQNIENVWSHLKRGIFGVYRHVSAKYLQAYADEFAWRYNQRNHSGRMFDVLLRQVAEVKLVKA